MQAFHLDMKVLQFRADSLEALFPRLRDAGYDTIIFEIENKVRLECLGAAVWCEAYEKNAFARLLDRCREAGLQPVPLIQTYAHLQWLLTHAPFHALREQPSIAYTLCPLKAESRTFLFRYLSEVVELFGNPHHIHLGGDEAAYMGTCPACKEVVDSIGKGGLYAQHMGRIATQALDLGSRPMIWADMVLAHPECLSQFPHEVIWVDWHYEMVPEGPAKTYLWGETGPQTPDTVSDTFRKTHARHAFSSAKDRFRPWFYADYLLDQGFDVLIASAASCGGDHPFLPSLNRAANVASACLKVREEPRLLGHLVTSWAMRLPPLETQWPLFHLPAILRSSPQPAEWKIALQQACDKTFGLPVPEFAKHWDKLGKSFPLAESASAFDWESGYVGQPPPVPLWFARRRHGHTLDLPKEIEDMNSLLTEYTRHAALLAPRLAEVADSNTPARLWLLGIEAIQLRAKEYMIYLQAENGNVDGPEAGTILRATESLADRWRTTMLEMFLPAGVECVHSILYGESRRLLSHISWGRYEKLSLA